MILTHVKRNGVVTRYFGYNTTTKIPKTVMSIAMAIFTSASVSFMPLFDAGLESGDGIEEAKELLIGVLTTAGVTGVILAKEDVVAVGVVDRVGEVVDDLGVDRVLSGTSADLQFIS